MPSSSHRLATRLAASALLAIGFAATPPIAAAGAPPRLVPEAFTHAGAVDDVVREARALPPGGRLTVDGVDLDDGATPALLDLERFQVFTRDARIVVHGEDGESELPPPRHAWFRGRLAGEPGSRALLTVLEDGTVRGLVETGGQAWRLAEEEVPATGGRRLRARRLAGDAERQPFACGNEEHDLVPPAEAGLDALTGALQATTGELTTTPYTARLAVETDWEFYLKFGNVADATAYVADLVGFASAIYDDEIDTDVQVTYLSLWTTSSDPWAQSNPSCALYDFGRYWYVNRTGVVRTTAHFLSGKSTNAGVAWVGVLCENAFLVNLGTSCAGLSPAIDYYGGAYGYTSGIDANFNPDSPQKLWDIIATSHEIGHNFNSPHTHCYNGLGGSSQPVDKCYNGQASQGCYAGSTSLPCATPGGACGTLMSYCHLLSPGLTNIAFSFGAGHPYGTLPQRVPDRMRAHVELEASFNPACLARISACTDDLLLASGTITGSQTYEVCGTITAPDGFRVGSTGDVTMIGGERVVFQDGSSVANGGSLAVGN